MVLDNFIFSVGVAAPIFLVMCIGYILRKKDIINNGFIQVANKLVFYVALPVKLFNEVRTLNLQNLLDLKFVSFILTGTILSVLLAWFISGFAINKKSQKGAFIHGVFRGNFLYLGLSLMENITGTIGEKAPIVVAVVIPLYNILAVIVLSLNRMDKEAKTSIKEQIYKILTNPMIIAIFLGIISIVLKLEIPLVAGRTMSYFESLATPLALLTIGATFDFSKITDNLKPALIASILRLLIVPFIAVMAASFIGFNNQDIILVYILFGVPTATASFIMTAAMGGDQELASSIIMVTTLLSIISITLYIFVFKTIGII